MSFENVELKLNLPVPTSYLPQFIRKKIYLYFPTVAHSAMLFRHIYAWSLPTRICQSRIKPLIDQTFKMAWKETDQWQHSRRYDPRPPRACVNWLSQSAALTCRKAKSCRQRCGQPASMAHRRLLASVPPAGLDEGLWLANTTDDG